MNTIGTIREISRFADYSRFGRRPSPTSIIGSRFSSVSSTTASGCWCPYALIVLMVVFVIASLVASNFSIYFLMKDNCDANMAKMEREWALQIKRHPTGPQMPSPLSDNHEPSADLKRHLNPSPKVLVPQGLDTSTEPVTNKIFARAPVEKKQSSIAFVPETKREKNVAGILQLVATIRFPLQSEPSNFLPDPSSANSSSIEDMFDLAKYFSLKPSSTTPVSSNINRNKRENFIVKKYRREKYFIKV